MAGRCRSDRTAVLSLMAVVLLSAVASAQDSTPEKSPASPDPKIASLIRQLADEQWEVRERATSSLTEMGAACAPQVVEAMRGSESPEVRSRARRILIAIGEWRQAPELVEEKVQDDLASLREGEIVAWNPESMAEPMDILRNDPDSAPSVLSDPVCIPALTRALVDAEPVFRANVAWCLGRTRSPSAVEPLRALVLKSDEEETVRALALWGLGRIGERSAAPVITEALGDPSLAVRCAAAIVAERLCERATLPFLLNALESEEATLRYHAFYTLTRLTGRRFGYNAYAKAERRTEAVAAWRVWWGEHGAAFEPERPSADNPLEGEKPK